MEERPQALFFEEEQSFPLWIRAIVLLPFVAFGYPTILMWFRGGADSGLVRVLSTVTALVAFGGAALTFRTKLVTKLNSSNLRLRIYPLKWNVLPRRMTQKDIALSDIRRWEVRTYNFAAKQRILGMALLGPERREGRSVPLRDET